jgi:hypothetical protein
MDERSKPLAAATEGTLFVEYTVLVGFVGLVVAVAIAALGFPLLRLYRFVQFVVEAPVV